MGQDDRRAPPQDEARPGPDAPRVRSGTFFRALVVGAVASLAPAAGCYESEPDYGVPADASDSDARDTADAADDATTDWPLPPYGAPEYATPDYGDPVYGIP